MSHGTKTAYEIKTTYVHVFTIYLEEPSPPQINSSVRHITFNYSAEQAHWGCARSRLLLKICVVAKRMVCTTINLVVLYTLYGMYIIKGGERSAGATD